MKPRTNKKRRLSRPFGRIGVVHEGLEPRCLLTTLAISEINYHPYAPVPDFGESRTAEADDFEFIELLNTGTESVNLSGIKLVQVEVDGKLEGVSFTFGNQSLAANQHIVVVQNLQAFRTRYGELVPVAGQWTGGKLGDNDELLTLQDASNQPIFQVTYRADSDWPTRRRVREPRWKSRTPKMTPTTRQTGAAALNTVVLQVGHQATAMPACRSTKCLPTPTCPSSIRLSCAI